MKRNNLLKVPSGFTLIELLIIIAVIGMLSSLGVSSFIGYSRSQTLSQATANFVNTLNTAKSKAYSQVKPDLLAACSGNNTLNGYIVSLTSNSYLLNVSCSGGPPSTLSTTSLGNITITPAPKTIFFQVLTGGVVGDGKVTITDSYGKSKTVTISPIGVIKVQ
jgi:prepilin-type N-terminal cleavage/methylation domain-containing protein